MTFSNGQSVPVGTLANDGSATPVALPGNITTTSLRFTVNSVSSSSNNIGLSELVVMGTYTPYVGFL